MPDFTLIAELRAVPAAQRRDMLTALARWLETAPVAGLPMTVFRWTPPPEPDRYANVRDV